MKKTFQHYRVLSRRFARADQGSTAIEAILVAPALIVLIMFCYTYFAAFEAKSAANKANYTVSDYLSRQTDAVDVDFLDGLAELYRFLTNEGDIDMRTSAVQYVAGDSESDPGSYEIVWSHGYGGFNAYTDNDIGAIEDRLPLLADGEEVLLVQTSRPWTPYYRVGLASLDFYDVVTTKPRFASQVVFDDGSTVDDGETHADSDDSDVDTSGSHSGTNTSGGSYGGGRHGGGGYHRR